MNLSTNNRFLNLKEWRKRKWCFDWLWLAKTTLPQGARTICEVGVGPLDISILPFFENSNHCQRLIGIEPYSKMADAAEKLEGVEIFRLAVADEKGTKRLYLNEGSSYIEGNCAPTPVKKSKRGLFGFKKKNSRATESEANFENVATGLFREIDDGEIDVLNVDCEGGEIHVFRQMISRPKLIGVELFDSNPSKDEITQWLLTNHYKLRISSGGEGETEIWALDV